MCGDGDTRNLRRQGATASRQGKGREGKGSNGKGRGEGVSERSESRWRVTKDVDERRRREEKRRER